jgi:DNA helicase-2/ATP-dependent DNA helicase PcrA
MNIPFKVVGALRFFDREEIKDALALLSLLMNPADPVAFKRMVNKPSRGIGDMSIEKIINLADSERIDLVTALEKASTNGLLSGKAAGGARMFVDAVKAGRSALDERDNVSCLQVLLSRAGLDEHYRRMDLANRTDKTDNLGVLVSEIGEYGNGPDALATFLESLMLDPTTIGRKDPSKQPGVTLITMHNTKGLEFDRVFIAGMEEGLFPGRQCESDEDLEEERRIFYVAITRARTQLHMSYCVKRTLWGTVTEQRASRFMAELPKNRLVGDDEAPQGRSGYRGYGALGEKRLAGAVQGRSFRNANIIRSASREVPVLSVATASQGRRDTTAAYRVGDAVYHEEYGEGEVRSIHQLRDRQMVDVRFATGKAVSFFADSALLEKIGSF